MAHTERNNLSWVAVPPCTGSLNGSLNGYIGLKGPQTTQGPAGHMEPVEIYYPGGGGRSAVSVQRVSGGLYSHFYEDEVRSLAGTR